MTTLNDIVSVTITRATTTPTRVGFGTPLITAYHTVFPERYRIYSSLSAMVTDGFTTTSAAYRMVTAVFAQNPRPNNVVVGRTENDEVMTLNITPNSSDLRASYAYKVYHNGVEAKYTTDDTPTVAEITAGLAAAIDPAAWVTTTAYAIGDHVTNDTGPVKIYICTAAGTSGATGPTGTGSGITDGTVTWNYVGPKSSITATDNTTYVSVAADTVADMFYMYGVLADYDLLHFADVTADGTPNGIVADLTAIRAQYDDWYCLLPTNQGKNVLSALAAAIEAMSQRKIMVCSSPDNDIYDSTSTTDIAATLQTAGYDRTAIMYHYKANTQYPCGGWAGKLLPQDPGTVTWAFKTLSGIDVMANLSDTHTTAIQNKDANFYVQIAGVSIMLNGEVSGNEYLDIIRGTDALEARIQEYVFGALANAGKIPFTNVGASQVEAQVRAALSAFTATTDSPERLLTNNPAPTVTVPDVATVSTTDKGNRLLPDVEFNATYAGAIHKTTIQGNISL